MMKDGHVGPQELVILLWFIIGSKIFLVAARVMSERALNSAWIAILGGGALASVVAVALYLVAQRFESKSIVEVSQVVFGPWLGRLLGLALFAYFVILATLRLREFSETIAAVILPRTPISVVMITYSVLMVYATQSGIEGIARSARLLLPFVALPALSLALAVLPWAQPIRILPIIDTHAIDLLKAGAYATTLFSEVVVIGLLAPYMRSPKGVLQGGIVGIGLSAAQMAAATVLTVMVFTLTSTLQLQFPTYDMASLVRLSKSVERVESLYVFVWFFSAALSLSTLFYCACLSFAQTLSLQEYKPLVWPLALVVYTLSFLPTNIVRVFQLDADRLGLYAGVGALCLPIVLLVSAVVLKRGGKEEASGG